jgi:hypothetical protein
MAISGSRVLSYNQAFSISGFSAFRVPTEKPAEPRTERIQT